MNNTEAREAQRAMGALVASMVIFGTIGIFRRHIDLPSSVIAMMRGFIGTAFLLLFVLATGKKLDLPAIRKNLVRLLISGAVMGFNWILLFEAYRFTSVATATLCYYMAPIIMMMVSPLLLKERLTKKKAVCMLLALAGMIPVSGVLEAGFQAGEMRGVLLGLGAAVLYATVVLMNKTIRDIGAYDKTIVQLLAAAIALSPYVLLTENLSAISLTGDSAAMMLLIGVVHTGFAYALYFGCTKHLSAQTLAIVSYVDPVVAILLSALLLGESMTPLGAAGAALVLGATLVSELPEKRPS